MQVNRLDSDVEVTQEDIKHALERPDSFGYNGDLPMFETWCMGPGLTTRDSGLLDRANAQALLNLLNEDDSLNEDWEITHCSHWGCGWIDHLSFRAVEDDGKTPTRIFRVLKEHFDFLREQYPVADDCLYSEMVYDAQLESISDNGSQFVDIDRAEEVVELSEYDKSWQQLVFSWLWDYEQSYLENVDDEAWVEGEGVRLAAIDLGIADIDECFDGESITVVVRYCLKHKLYQELVRFLVDVVKEDARYTRMKWRIKWSNLKYRVERKLLNK